MIKSEEISFNNFPMSVRGCGRQMSCFRSCSSSPTCDPENTDTYVVTFLSRDEKYVIASLGGVVNNDQVSEKICTENSNSFRNMWRWVLETGG